MGKLSLECKVSILISWALVLTCSAAKHEYFLQMEGLTWEQARNHCQVCYKELVTLTPENIQTIAKEQNVTSDCWVGLRKNYYYTSNSTSNSTSNFSMPWSRWANGDPLLFQNWYPGWPVFKSSSPKRYCCTCSTTAQGVTSSTGLTEGTTGSTTNASSFTDQTATASTDFGESFQTATASTDFGESFQTATASTDFGESFQTATASTDFGESNTTSNQNTTFTTAAPTMTTQPPEAGCVPILDLSDTDTNYIEDSCVAMLSFGAWVEKSCSELLPFICYEERFVGEVNVTSRSSESAVLTWLPGPGNISHYIVKVKGDKVLPQIETENLTCNLVNLTGGTRYSVQVFPVKCGRALTPEGIVLYTTPSKVLNLEATNVTETSVILSWDKPAGNLDFYLITVSDGKQFKSETGSLKVDSLLPGSLHTFTVISGVKDNSSWSEETSITEYTKPGKVSDLTVSNNTKDSLQLTWSPPKGSAWGYRVKALNDSNHILFEKNVTQPNETATGLPMGTKITLSVTALTNGTSLEGDNVTVVNYTAPGPISKLVLKTTHSSLNATWSPSEGNPSSYTVKLQLDGENVTTAANITQRTTLFEQLKNAANYTVIVYAFSGPIRSLPVARSKFTRPSPPTGLKAIITKKDEITFEWTAPVNISKAMYSIKINSSFWGRNKSEILYDKTTYTSKDLISGTRYDFEVKTKTEEEESESITLSHCTVPDKREISLSMLCSSAETLLCDNTTTRTSVFQQLKTHFDNLLGDSIFWELETEN